MKKPQLIVQILLQQRAEIDLQLRALRKRRDAVKKMLLLDDRSKVQRRIERLTTRRAAVSKCLIAAKQVVAKRVRAGFGLIEGGRAS